LHGSTIGRLGSRRLAGLPVACALGAALPAGAFPAVAEAAEITRAPAISGEARVGATLTAAGAEWSAGGTPTYRWASCSTTSPDEVCAIIPGAGATTYFVAAADEGRHLRVLLTVEDALGTASAISEPTAAIAPAAPGGDDDDEDDDDEDNSGPGRGGRGETIVPSAFPAPAPFDTAGTPATTPARPGLLNPFPIVRIRGHLTRTGARVTLLSVRAPRGARITVRCLGRTCPRRRLARSAALRRLRPFERTLRAGLRLEIRVTRPGFVGKHTLLLIRRGRPPLRRDRCLTPGSTRPTRCPG
jgi:hypothetical protein